MTNEWYQFYLRTGGLLNPIPLEDPFIQEIIRRDNIRKGVPEGSPLTEARIRHWAYRFDEERHWWGQDFDSVMPLPLPESPGRKGRVKLNGKCFEDDDGLFYAFTPSCFALFSKSDDWLDENLPWLHRAGATSIRALCMVGSPFWTNPPDHSINPFGNEYWTKADERLSLVHSLGMRVQLTLFADAQIMMPDFNDKKRFIDAWLEFLQGREESILYIELWNEYWRNGGDLDTLRVLTEYTKDRTDIIVAPSATTPFNEEYEEMHRGGIADLGIEHIDRKFGERGWRFTRQIWAIGGELRIGFSNNEPVGPGSSFEESSDPKKLITDMVNTHIANGTDYCLHTDPGIRGSRGRINYSDIENQAAIQTMFKNSRNLLPNDLPNWTRSNHTSFSHPFKNSFKVGGGVSNQFWPDGFNHGVHRAYCAISHKEFVMCLAAVDNFVDLTPTNNVTYSVIDPVSGTVLGDFTTEAGKTDRIFGDMESRLVIGVVE